VQLEYNSIFKVLLLAWSLLVEFSDGFRTTNFHLGMVIYATIIVGLPAMLNEVKLLK
jgi:hypothetical protein